MGNTMGKELIGSEAKAFATTLLVDFMCELHFDEEVAKATAEMIAELDKASDGDRERWKMLFGLVMTDYVIASADVINRAHKEGADGLS